MNIQDKISKMVEEALNVHLNVDDSIASHEISKGVIVRSYASGVHFGQLVSYNQQVVILKNARRLWSWFAIDGISLSEVARNGINAAKSKICQCVPEIIILDGIEIIPTSIAAEKTINNAKVFRA